MTTKRTLATRRGTITYPAFIPVTTYGGRYPLDELIRPYLPRLAPAVMVSHYYAGQMASPPPLPLFVDSGGFASLFTNARVRTSNKLGLIELKTEEGKELLEPSGVLDLQEKVADVAFTLDFPVPPDMERRRAKRRIDLTIRNAVWALENRRRRDLPLFGCIQGWDIDSYRAVARTLAAHRFDGFAIGGLVPRARDRKLVLGIIDAVRAEIGDRPLHVFGIGNPRVLKSLFSAGADSVDSSAYAQLAADGRLWNGARLPTHELSVTDRLHLALSNLAAASSTALPLSLAPFLLSTPSLRAAHTRISNANERSS